MDYTIKPGKRVMSKNLKNESGMTLVESMVAILILLVGLLTMAQVLTFSVMASKNLGRDSTKATAYACDRMEQLMSVPISDGSFTSGMDYINYDGSVATGKNGDTRYTRQWTITDTGSAKKIVVSVTSTKSFSYGKSPSTVLLAERTS
jgi:Tfp pilus assembly protein PilV